MIARDGQRDGFRLQPAQGVMLGPDLEVVASLFAEPLRARPGAPELVAQGGGQDALILAQVLQIVHQHAYVLREIAVV
jgi:hypothetical protein